MKISELFNLQGMLFIMMLVGALLKRRGILTEEGKRCLTDLCIDVVIPCSIIKSCLIEFCTDILRSCEMVLAAGILMQLLCVAVNWFLFNRYPEQQKKVLKYCTLASNGGFLGNPVAEGVYGSMGLLYASVFLIPMRIVMWGVGASYFLPGHTDRKKLVKTVLTHPCLVGIYIGMFLMFTQLPLPAVLEETIRSIGSCNSALTMFVVGTILAEVPLRSIFTWTTLKFSALRLGVLPAVMLGVCRLLRMDPVAQGVSVLMIGMPAAAMVAVFAARYDGDAPFATRCVVLTTLLSMVTIPLWSFILT